MDYRIEYTLRKKMLFKFWIEKNKLIQNKYFLYLFDFYLNLFLSNKIKN